MIVTQAWTHELSMMQQTVLLTAVRGPDGIHKDHPAKYILRWFRRCTLMSAMDGRVLLTPYDPGGGSFTGTSCTPEEAKGGWYEPMNKILGQYHRAADEMPHHFQMHVMHASEIVGYKHPMPYIREWWGDAYVSMVHAMHLWPETENELDNRLGDTLEGWAARSNPAVDGAFTDPREPLDGATQRDTLPL